MQIYYPEYYSLFCCIAENCPETCCKQWEVCVDPENYTYYQNCSGTIRQQLDQNIVMDSDEAKIACNGSFCPFLNPQKLCQIYIDLGEEHMPNVCKIYPRIFLEYGGRTEISLAPSCPEAARLLLIQNQPIRLICEQNDSPPHPNNIDGQLFYYLLNARTTALKMIQNRTGNLALRIGKLLALGKTIQIGIQKKEYFSMDTQQISPADYFFDQVQALQVLKKAEKLTKDWQDMLCTSPQSREYSEMESENILTYFLLHSFLTAVYDGQILDKIRFSVISLYILKNFGGVFSDTVHALYLYCREILHSDENVKLLQKNSAQILKIDD